MDPTDTTQISKVYLKTSRDWPRWLHGIQTTAVTAGIWDIVNPDSTTTDETVKEPTPPDFKKIKPDAQSVLDLNDTELKKLDQLWKYHTIELEPNRRKFQTYQTIQKAIIKTVDISLVPLMYGATTVREHLRRLRIGIGYTKIGFQSELLDRLEALVQGKGRGSINK